MQPNLFDYLPDFGKTTVETSHGKLHTDGQTKTLHRGQELAQAKILRYLMENGEISTIEANRVGRTVDSRKVFSRLRDMGYLYPANDPRGHRYEPNKEGHGTHRIHLWTGKR